MHRIIKMIMIGAAAATPAFAQQVSVPTKASDVTSAASDVLMHPEYVKTIGRMAYVWGWPMIRQVTDDEGMLAGRLNGFVGRSFGIGPIVTYSTKIGNGHLDFNARWIRDFDVKNTVEGNGCNFTASLKF